MPKGLWRVQFDDERFAVPAEVEDHPELEDESYGNDICPHFVCHRTGLELWVDDLTPENREFTEAKRFTVQDAEGNVSYEGDDLQLALSWVTGKEGHGR